MDQTMWLKPFLFVFIMQISQLNCDHVGKVWEVVPIKNPLEKDSDFVKAVPINQDTVLEVHQVSGHGDRIKREPMYHVLESEGLKSHFEILPSTESTQFDASTFWHRIGKRAVELQDEPSKQQSRGPDGDKKLSDKYTNIDESKNEALPDKIFPNNREARGATKEQWIKQPYPVDFQSQKISNNDQRTSSSNNDDLTVRAPRVHFVTNQKRLEPSESRDRQSDVQRVQPSPNTGSAISGSPRTTRMYDSRGEVDSPPSPNLRVFDPYEYKERRRSYERDYNRYDLDTPRYPTTRYNEYELNHRLPAQKKPQRIIYYASLPEVVRTPPNVDLRYRSPEPPIPPPYDRYDRHYGQGLHDGQVTSSPVSVADTNAPVYYDRDNRYDLPATYIPRHYRKYPNGPPPPPLYPVNYGSYHSSQLGYEGPEPLPPPYRRRPFYPENYERRPLGPAHDLAGVNKERLTDGNRNPDDIPPSSGRRDKISGQYLSSAKISAAVNVKDNDRKIPERVVYADRERQYVYAPPSFQLADDESVNNFDGDTHSY